MDAYLLGVVEYAVEKQLITAEDRIFAVNSLLAALGRKGRAPNWNLDKYREARQSGWTCDASRLREELGYAPALTLDQGMQEAVEGYRREGLL